MYDSNELKKLEKLWLFDKLKQILLFLSVLALAVLLFFVLTLKPSSKNFLRDTEVKKIEAMCKDKIIYKDKIVYQTKIIEQEPKLLALDLYFLNNIKNNPEVFNMWSYFTKKNYKQSCINMGKYVSHNYNRSVKDEDILNFYAYSCLKAGYISMLKTPIIKLNHSKQARSNAAYFSTIFYLKKIIYSMVLDGVDMKAVSLPRVDYFLSNVFEALKTDKYTVINDRIIIKHNEYVYKIYKREIKAKSGIVIKVFNKSKLMFERKIY